MSESYSHHTPDTRQRTEILREEKERKAPDWRKVSVLEIDAREYEGRIYSDDVRNAPIDVAYIEQATSVLKAALRLPPAEGVNGADVRAAQETLRLLGYYKELLARGVSELPAVSTKDILPDECALSAITMPKEGTGTLGNKAAQFLRECTGDIVVSLSNSHVTTAEVFTGMEQTGEFDLSKTALFVIDHHTDIPLQSSGLGKATVLHQILRPRDGKTFESSLARHAAVFGPYPGHERHDRKPFALLDVKTGRKTIGKEAVRVFLGKDLYQEGRPSLEKFMAHVREVAETWKKLGLQQVYTSIDLDGLRLDQGYTATDYNPFEQIKLWLQDPSVKAEIEKISQGTHTEGSEAMTEGLKGIIATLHQDMFNNRGMTRPYYGVPASWIAHALEYFQEEGFEIGITGKDGKTVVGDIVEYLPEQDYRGSTGKISRALLDRMVRIAQAGKSGEVE